MGFQSCDTRCYIPQYLILFLNPSAINQSTDRGLAASLDATRPPPSAFFPGSENKRAKLFSLVHQPHWKNRAHPLPLFSSSHNCQLNAWERQTHPLTVILSCLLHALLPSPNWYICQSIYSSQHIHTSFFLQIFFHILMHSWHFSLYIFSHLFFTWARTISELPYPLHQPLESQALRTLHFLQNFLQQVVSVPAGALYFIPTKNKP